MSEIKFLLKKIEQLEMRCGKLEDRVVELEVDLTNNEKSTDSLSKLIAYVLGSCADAGYINMFAMIRHYEVYIQSLSEDSPELDYYQEHVAMLKQFYKVYMNSADVDASTLGDDDLG